MKVVTAQEMQYIDKSTIESFGIPGEVLMAQAGRAVFDKISELFIDMHRVLVFSGTGNNGGDGFVIAYHLKNSGIDVRNIITGSPKKLSSESLIFYELCKHSGIEIEEAETSLIEAINFKDYDLVIDAMTGTGFNGSARGMLNEIILAINNAKRNSSLRVIAVDIPSGLPADGETPEGNAVIADVTVTIGLPKISLVTFPGMSFTGNMHVVDIGFPSELVQSSDISAELITSDLIRSHIGLPRKTDTYKHSEGHLLLIGGFHGMEGAIMLCAMAAMESGAGLVTIATTESSRNIIAGKIPESMTVSIDENNIEQSLQSLFKDKSYNAVVLGPGLGRSTTAEKVVTSVLTHMDDLKITKLLIDGDGLYHSADYFLKNNKDLTAQIILTPHFMEASRLTGQPITEIKNNRFKAAKYSSQSCKTVTVLKGPATIVSNGDKCYINTTGNPALAAAGSGDVLSGIIGSLMLKTTSLVMAAAAGVHIHGSAADQYCTDNQSNILKAGDIISNIKSAINSLIDK